MGEGTPVAPPLWWFSLEIKLPTGEGEWGAEDVLLGPDAELSRIVGIEPGPPEMEVGGETERRALINGPVELIRLSGSLDGRELPAIEGWDGGIWLLGFAAERAERPAPEAPEEDDELARITAAAALGAERLLSGTSGAWNRPAKIEKFS